MQKGVFYVVKGHLLQCKRAPFKMQKDTFWNPDVNLSYISLSS